MECPRTAGARSKMYFRNPNSDSALQLSKKRTQVLERGIENLRSSSRWIPLEVERETVAQKNPSPFRSIWQQSCVDLLCGMERYDSFAARARAMSATQPVLLRQREREMASLCAKALELGNHEREVSLAVTLNKLQSHAYATACNVQKMLHHLQGIQSGGSVLCSQNEAAFVPATLTPAQIKMRHRAQALARGLERAFSGISLIMQGMWDMQRCMQYITWQHPAQTLKAIEDIEPDLPSITQGLNAVQAGVHAAVKDIQQLQRDINQMRNAKAKLTTQNGMPPTPNTKL